MVQRGTEGVLEVLEVRTGIKVRTMRCIINEVTPSRKLLLYLIRPRLAYNAPGHALGGMYLKRLSE